MGVIKKERLVRWSWVSWQDAETHKSFGESTDMDFALSLARRIACEPLIAGQTRFVEFFAEPAHILLRRFYPSGEIVNFAEPTVQAEKISPPAYRPTVGHGGKREIPPTPRELAQRDLRWNPQTILEARREQAGVPFDGKIGLVPYIVGIASTSALLEESWRPNGESDDFGVYFIASDLAQAQEKSGVLKSQGQDCLLLDSLLWKPLTQA